MVDKRIRAIRRSKGLSQKDLATKLYVSPQAVSKWENGTSTPNPDAIVSMAEIFGVSTDYLLGYTPEDKKTPAPKSGGGQDESINSLLQELREGMQGLPEEQVEFFASLLRAMISQLSRTPGNSSADPEASEETVPQLEHANPM